MRRSDFHYELPEELIAQEPLPERSDSRLLVLDPDAGRLEHRRFAELPALLEPGDLLVFNDTRVIPARLYGRKSTGGQVEILIERLRGPRQALAHLRASKAPRAGETVTLEGDAGRVIVTGRDGALFTLEFEDDAADMLERAGHVPLPPYIRREDRPADRERYQTVYARESGSVAAPTAGLHFDGAVLAALAERGIETAFVTLHVGAGTFAPVRAERVEDHVMHQEWLRVDAGTAQRAAAARARGGRVVAVGTTSVRSLETAARDGRLAPYEGETDLFIRPGYRFRAIDAMITNFHLPESTLLMLVSAFSGRERILEAYRAAVAERYRFFSYGDAMLLFPAAGALA